MKKIIIIIMIFGTGFALLNLNPDLRTDPEYSRISSHIVQAWDSKKDAEELAYYNEELLKAARNGDLTTVQTMIANGADINWTSAAGSGETSLIAASRLGHCEIVEYLISQGANVNLVTNNRLSALSGVMSGPSSTESLEIIRVLLENGALVEESLLKKAKEGGLFEYVEYIKAFLEKENVVSEQKLLGDGQAYYGLIMDYTHHDWVPMQLEIKITKDQSGDRVSGSYIIYYFADLKEVKFSGNSSMEQMRLSVQNKERTAKEESKEEIYVTWDHGDSQENPLYPERLFGTIQKGAAEYVFEVQREQRIIEDTIDPLADSSLSRREMEVFKDLVFGGDLYIDLGAGSYAPINIDYYNDLPVEDLILVGEEIRNQSWNTLVSGTIVRVQQREYDFFFSRASTAPQYMSGYFGSWSNQALDYLKRWSTLSIHNFRLYVKFMEELKKSEEKVCAFYQTAHDFSKEEAQEATRQVLARIIDRAAGSYPGAGTGYFEIDTLSPLLEGVFAHTDERLLMIASMKYFFPSRRVRFPALFNPLILLNSLLIWGLMLIMRMILEKPLYTTEYNLATLR